MITVITSAAHPATPPPTSPTAAPTINQTLAERGSRYGSFTGHARVAQAIKAIMRNHDRAKWDSMDNDQREALEMVAHKIGRIINGDPDYEDSWRDIAGYITLVSARLLEEQTKPKQQSIVLGQEDDGQPD
jgi:hypothetical protein